jgi:hypothetical protein
LKTLKIIIWISNLRDFAVVDVNGLRASPQPAAKIALKKMEKKTGKVHTFNRACETMPSRTRACLTTMGFAA